MVMVKVMIHGQNDISMIYVSLDYDIWSLLYENESQLEIQWLIERAFLDFDCMGMSLWRNDIKKLRFYFGTTFSHL